MGKWEYKTMQIHPPWFEDTYASQRTLNNLGAEGWKVIHAQRVMGTDKAWVILRREADDE